MSHNSFHINRESLLKVKTKMLISDDTQPEVTDSRIEMWNLKFFLVTASFSVMVCVDWRFYHI